MTVAVLGIDLAKRVFQLHGIDTRGRAVVSRRIGRSRLVETVVQLAPAVIALRALDRRVPPAPDDERGLCAYQARGVHEEIEIGEALRRSVVPA